MCQLDQDHLAQAADEMLEIKQLLQTSWIRCRLSAHLPQLVEASGLCPWHFCLCCIMQCKLQGRFT